MRFQFTKRYPRISGVPDNRKRKREFVEVRSAPRESRQKIIIH